MANKLGKFVASIVELFTREIKATGEKKVYTNDVDNLYPNRVELVERNSVTASACSNKLKSFIVGKGFKNKQFNEMIVNPKTKMKGYQFLDKIGKSMGTQKGVWVHVNYDFEGDVNFLEVLPFKKNRIAKEDSLGYPGCIYFKDWEETKKSFNKDDDSCKWFYPFNKDVDIINAQRKKDAIEKVGENFTVDDLITCYRGQVFFLNLEYDSVYPHAWLHPAYNDCDSEYRFSLYSNTMLRNGFLDKTILVSNGLDTETTNEFEDNVKKWLGAENSSSVMTFSIETPVDDPSKLFSAVTLKGNYDTARFEKDRIAFANNIRKAYLSIPNILIEPQDSFFGSNATAFIEAVKYYNSETSFIRENIAYMMDKFFDGDFSIQELGASDLATVVTGESSELPKTEVSAETAAAQANLRGSVGGVQGILAVQQSYSQQLTTLESAITIFVEIYGFTREVALSLLGNPEIKTEENENA